MADGADDVQFLRHIIEQRKDDQQGNLQNERLLRSLNRPSNLGPWKTEVIPGDPGRFALPTPLGTNSSTIPKPNMSMDQSGIPQGGMAPIADQSGIPQGGMTPMAAQGRVPPPQNRMPMAQGGMPGIQQIIQALFGGGQNNMTNLFPGIRPSTSPSPANMNNIKPPMMGIGS